MEYQIKTKAFYNGKMHRARTDKVYRQCDYDIIMDFIAKKQAKQSNMPDYKLEYAIITDKEGKVIWEE